MNTKFIDDLIELRQRFLRCLYMVLGLFTVLFYFSNPIFHALALPLLHYLPSGQHLIATSVVTPVLIPLKFTFILSLVLACPFWLHQLWGFIAPGLYRREKHFILLILIPSVLLFFLGMIFAYFIALPMTFRFFASVLPPDVAMMPDISQYLDFTLQMFLAFGIAFEVPIITVVVILSGLVSIETLAEKRPYFIVGSFIVGMLLTPPEVISQILLAVPMCLLFELGLYIARVLEKKRQQPELGRVAV